MRTTVAEIAVKHWQARFPSLLQEVDDTLRQLESFLNLEEYYEGMRRKPGRLQQTFGGFGTEVLDMASLSKVLSKGYQAKGMHKDRSKRMHRLYDDLRGVREAWDKQPPPVGEVELSPDVEGIMEAFEAHMRPLSQLFRMIRIAHLEVKGRYSEKEFAAFFERFSWRDLESAEMALCPPFLVYSPPRGHFGEFLGTLVELVTRGRPLKVVLTQAALSNGRHESGRAAGLQSVPDAGLLFLSLRSVYFLQHSGADTDGLAGALAQGLDSPRPGVFSLLADAQGDAGHERAALALQSRAFPHFSYDPDRADDFVSCLDLSDNPEVEALWPQRVLEHLDDSGTPSSMERPYTPADFAVEEAKARGEASDAAALDEESDGAGATPLTEFLGMEPAQRRDRTPFVFGVNGDGRLTRLVPSQALIAKTADRLHVWHTLQELGGIGNPYVQAAERNMRDALAAEKEEALAALRAELEAKFQEREGTAISQAMKTLAQRLTGQIALDATPAPAAAAAAPSVESAGEAAPAPAAAPAAAAAPAPAPAGDGGPWLEQTLCTSCDECMAINKKIFAYDGNKKAVITDPKGGPYRDIVKAAEKCSSGAIHPGAPLDPSEKDLEKWIKRAEKYQ